MTDMLMTLTEVLISLLIDIKRGRYFFGALNLVVNVTTEDSKLGDGGFLLYRRYIT